MSVVLFLKSLIAGYTRRDGTVVAPHSDKRTKRTKPAPGQLALFDDAPKPIPPTPLKGLDPVKATPDMFGHDHEHLLSDLPSGSKWKRGKGMIDGHYGVELDGDVISNFHKRPEDAVTEAHKFISNKAAGQKSQADREKAITDMRGRLLAGGEPSDADLKLLGLRDGNAGLKWFIPAAAEVFGISSREVRPHIAKLIRIGHSDMGTEKEFVSPKTGLKAIAGGLGSASKKTAPTDTPAFKKWFGDSKVVDGSGKPLVLYHGTMADFSTFDAQAKRKDGNKRTTINSGMFLSKSKEFASGYANREGGNVMPVYAKVTNPFDWKNEEHIKIALDAYEKRFGEPMFDSYAAELKKRGWWASLEGELVNILIRDHGFDGIWMTEGGETNLYVPNSNQIKSATGNNGDYSDHGDITKSILFLKARP